MIPLFLLTASLQLTNFDYFIAGLAIFGFGYLFLSMTGLDRIVYKKFGLNKTKRGEDSIISHSIASLIPTSIAINGVPYPVPPADGVQSVKVDPSTNEWTRVINYVGDDGKTYPLKVTKGRLTVDVDNPRYLEGLENPLIYLSDSDLSRSDIIINELKDRIKDQDMQIKRLKEELAEARKPKSYQVERRRQRTRGMPIPSSRVFGKEEEENTPDWSEDEGGDDSSEE
jgi:hypothetical protein